MARPPKEINWDIVEQKIKSGCTAKQIYSSRRTKMDSDTFYKRFKEEYGCSFSDYSAEVSEEGIGDILLSLHAKAHNNKHPGNAQLLMFLAKCRCGLREPEIAAYLAPNQSVIDQTHRVMELENELAQLKALHADKSETE